MNAVPAFETYPFIVDPLLEQEGGGFAITFPDLPGCIADGETIELAIAHGRDAFREWMESMLEDRKPIPKPHSGRRKRFKNAMEDSRDRNAHVPQEDLEAAIEETLTDYPDRLRPVNSALLGRIKALVGHIDADLDKPLSAKDE